MKSIIRLLWYTKKYTHLLVLTALALAGITGMNLIVPWYIRELTSLLTGSEFSKGLPRVHTIALVLLASYILKLVFRFLYSYLSHVAAWNVVAELRTEIYAHLQKLSLSYFADRQTGHLMSKVMNDTALLEQLVAHSIPDIITNFLVLLGVSILLLIINVKLTLLTLIPVPFIFILTYLFSKKVLPYFRQAQECVAELNASLQDNLSGIREIQAFNQQEREKEEVGRKAKKHASYILRALRLSAIFHPSIEFFTSTGTVIVVGFGGVLAVHNQLSVADIIGFLFYLSMFYTPVTVFARVSEEYQQAVAGAERIFEVLDTEPDIKDAPDAKEISGVRGDIEFKNVSFGYDDSAEVLKNVSFSVKAGQMLAIVGPTGVGKTTIINLIERFYEPTEGCVTMDGIDTRRFTLTSLRNQISLVLQDVFLFSGTIAENIAYGCKNASTEDIINAAKAAYIHDFIKSLPEGYDTYVGERGVRLSGGQKQRIAIARAVLRNSPILIFDEATSAVDVETELQIQRAIMELAGKHTIIVIAHRLSTVRRADKIIVLNEGRIEEEGTHDELIAKNGFYARLCRTALK